MKVKHNSVNFSVPTVDGLSSTFSKVEDGDVCIVSDVDRGGTFIYDSTRTAENNSGTVFNGWVRKYEGAVNIKWFGAITNTDSTSQIAKAFSLGKDVYLPKGNTYFLSDYISVNSNTRVVLDSTIIRLRSDVAGVGKEFYPSGFDFNKVENVEFTGNGTISDENLLTYNDANYPMNGNSVHAGYSPAVHVRSCTNVKILDINLYKVKMGIAIGISDSPYYPDFNLIPYPESSYNCHVKGVNAKFCSFFAMNLNSCYNSSMSGSYVYRAGDGGIFTQFSHQCSIHNNVRESPYGDGSSVADILSINDVQGITIENSHDIQVHSNIVKGFYNGINVINNSTDVSVSNNSIYESQAFAIAARGGDSIYGLNSNVKINDNLIVNCGYAHTTDLTWVNHPYKGGIYIDDTYQAVVSNNTISGFNSTYAGEPVRAKGLEIADLGFWSSKSVEDRISYSSLVIENNSVIFNEHRSNYIDYTGFESRDCNLSGIKSTGIWGKIIIDSNKLLANAFADGRYSVYASLAGIEISSTGAAVGEATIQSLSISNNTISYWNGGGIYVNIENEFYDKAALINISNNNIDNLPGYGMYLTNFNASSITNNVLKNIGKVSNSSNYDKAITLLNVHKGLVDDNVVTNTEGIVAMYGYVNCLYVDSSLIYEGGNIFEKGTGDTASYLTSVNGSSVQSALNSVAYTTTNATGNIIKYGDGTMITTQEVTSNAPNVANGSIYTSNPLAITFPATFISKPTGSSSCAWASNLRVDSTTAGNVWVTNGTSVVYGTTVQITLIGRWK